MIFEALVETSHVVLNLAADDKWRALDELCHIAEGEGLLAGAGAIDLITTVTDRERSLSTGMEAGLAVPHAFVSGLADPCLIFALSPGGIPWDALDGQPTRLIAFLIAPATAEARETHLETLARLSGVWVEPSRRAIALAALDAAAIRAVFSPI